jgi:hypothetical protein
VGKADTSECLGVPIKAEKTQYPTTMITIYRNRFNRNGCSIACKQSGQNYFSVTKLPEKKETYIKRVTIFIGIVEFCLWSHCTRKGLFV